MVWKEPSKQTKHWIVPDKDSHRIWSRRRAEWRETLAERETDRQTQTETAQPCNATGGFHSCIARHPQDEVAKGILKMEMCCKHAVFLCNIFQPLTLPLAKGISGSRTRSCVPCLHLHKWLDTREIKTAAEAGNWSKMWPWKLPSLQESLGIWWGIKSFPM